MQRSEDEQLRKPNEILAAMDKPGVRSDTNLLYQLTAELHASLAKEAGVTSEAQTKLASTGVTIGRIALFVAILALAVGVIQTINSFISSPPQLTEEEFQQQMGDYQRQVAATDSQLEKSASHLKKSEEQARRFDNLLAAWELQGQEQEELLKTIRTLTSSLDAAANQPTAEQGGAGQPATRSESDSEGSDKPQLESEGRSR